MDPSVEVILHQRRRAITRVFKRACEVIYNYSYWNNITRNDLDGHIQCIGGLIGLFSPQCTENNRTNLGNRQTNCVYGSCQLVNECMRRNQSMMNDVVHAWLIVKKMIIYYNDQNELEIEIESIR